jgi:hypothetical protein
MSICGNFVELVERSKVFTDTDFERCFDTNLENNNEIEIYIERTIIPELEEKSLIIIEAAIGNVESQEVGMLFIKRNSNAYGM